MTQRIDWILAVLISGSLTVGVSNAQPSKAPDGPSPLSTLFNVDAFLNSYVHLVAKKYKLTKEQEQITAQLVRSKATAFIDNHEDEMYTLLERMFDVRAGDDMTVEELMAWGQQARPIYEEAKQIVIESNDEWREILTDEQKVIHDGDVALMWDNFLITENQLDRMEAGTMTVEEFRNPGASYKTPKDVADEPPVDNIQPEPVQPTPVPQPDRDDKLPPPKRGSSETPQPDEDSKAKPTPTKPAPPARPQDPKTFDTAWDKYTQDFIAKYQLNEAQSQKAEAILAGCKRQGQQVVLHSEKRLEQIDAQLDELRKNRSRDKSAAEMIERYEDQRAKLVQPLTDIFEKRLKPQLDKLPTRAQREEAEKTPEKKPTPKRTSPRTSKRSRK